MTEGGRGGIAILRKRVNERWREGRSEGVTEVLRKKVNE